MEAHAPHFGPLHACVTLRARKSPVARERPGPFYCCSSLVVRTLLATRATILLAANVTARMVIAALETIAVAP